MSSIKLTKVKCLNEFNGKKTDCYMDMNLPLNNPSKLLESSYYYSIDIDGKKVVELILDNEISVNRKKEIALKMLKRIYPFFNSFDEYPDDLTMVCNKVLLDYFYSFVNLLIKNMNDEPYVRTCFSTLLGLSYFIENNVEYCPIDIKVICEKRKVQFCSKCYSTTINKKEVKLLRCGGCVPRDGAKGDKTNKVFYCSISCQKDDWKEHKKVCQKFN